MDVSGHQRTNPQVSHALIKPPIAPERITHAMTTQPSVDSTNEPATTGHDKGPTPALLTINDAVRVLRLSRSVVYALIKDGRLRVVHQGRAARIPAAAINEYVSLLESESGHVSDRDDL